MPALSFILSPEGVVRIHDAILCLSKFGEVVGLEARRDKLIFTTLNSSKSAYASFTLEKNFFFQSYHFSQILTKDRDEESRFTCQMYNKALLSVFKGRMMDTREKDTSIERCEVSVQDRPDKIECRLIIKMICRHGVTKTYKLTYESVEVMHALFDKNTARNRWTISAYVLKSFSEYFGVKTEQLDLHYEGGRVTFTSYTEKIMDGNEILKQPLQTSIAIDTLDFEDFEVEEKLHIGISVRDFKAIVTHAETLKTTIRALYSRPTRPILLSYQEHGMLCEFTLMTIGEYRSGSITPMPSTTRDRSSRPSTRDEVARLPAPEPGHLESEAMPPPSQAASRSFVRETTIQRPVRPLPPRPKASIDHESLFLPNDDEEERRWSERNYDEDELGWDASDTFTARPQQGASTISGSSRAGQAAVRGHDDDKRIAPTQPISKIRGMFDE